MSQILITLTSRSDSDFEHSNINLKENKLDGVDLNSNGLAYCVRKNEGKILWFSADCIGMHVTLSLARFLSHLKEYMEYMLNSSDRLKVKAFCLVLPPPPSHTQASW